ncbi:hypothetical protein [Clostridium guangxiense]|uniref:hypothetical protein n=1 Tax=Clostridium guangxiense TaxID=1662055 RepID=UPI001E41ACAE|nr:hypothetical protein [Clostridium guangxiense]MCD2348545.1 hypothetical protein [Clostridium guangxiense]
MARIYSNNKKYNGISAGINFVNGVGETEISHLISWFNENGYTVVEDKILNYDDMKYKELTEVAKEKGINGIGLKKDELIKKLKEMEE